MSKATVSMVARETGKMKPHSFTAKAVQSYEDMFAYRDQSISWVFATRGSVPIQVVNSWDTIQWPMNQFHSLRLNAVGMEVGAAYNALFRGAVDRKFADHVLQHAEPQYRDGFVNARFILTTEEDNIIEPWAVQKMLEAIYRCPDCNREVASHCAGKKRMCKPCGEWRCEKGHKGYDAIGALYWIKSDPPIPMAFGDPKRPGDFRPRSVAAAIKKGKVIEVNGIAMGCSLFRKDIFKHLKLPWFKTSPKNTQDLFLAAKAKKELGARFGVHCGIEIGHLDINSGTIL